MELDPEVKHPSKWVNPWLCFSQTRELWSSKAAFTIAFCAAVNHNRDLTVRQRRRPWKRRWQIDFASFQTFSRLSQFTLLLKRREFWLELKRRDRAGIQTEMKEFIALPFPFSSKQKIWSFHVVVVKGHQKNVQKSVMHVQRCCFAH